MEMKIVILISFTLGFIAGWGSDKAKENYYSIKGSFLENTIPPLSIIFLIYAFFQSFSFGFMSILQIMLGAYIGGKSNRFIKKYYKKISIILGKHT